MNHKIIIEKPQNSLNSKPFLRWAGGKNWLLKDIHKLIPPEGYNNYVEPFLGGGSIFFHLAPKMAFLSDLNPSLTETYSVIKDNVKDVIHELKEYKNTSEFYYLLRAKQFNNPIERAARFIYLNQTSFNGIYRENLKGQYNVPYGNRSKSFLDEDTLIKASSVLQPAIITSQDFESSLANIHERDLVFIDPPYTVTHNNNGFIKYNAKLFDYDAQIRLSKYIDSIKNKGAYYILTNAAHQEVKKIFEKPNDTLITTSRASLIGGKMAKRGLYEEYIFTNVISK